MASDDLIYMLFLVISVPLGYFVKKIEDTQKRRLIPSVLGMCIVLLVSGVHTVHSLVTIIVNTAIVTLISPKLCHLVSFIWCFGYIVFFRTTYYFGLPTAPAHTNAIQLVLTLKMVGLAFEIHDTYRNKEEAKRLPNDETVKLRNKYCNVDPSILDTFLYSYCYIGVLTGPYYKYRTYHDMLHQTNSRNIDTFKAAFNKLKWIPVYAVAFLVASSYFTVNYARTDEFYDEPFWFRLLYMTPVFFIFRMRFYVAWVTAEVSCVTAGLGAYPSAARSKVAQGPTDLQALKQCEHQAPEGVAYDFETVRNINTYYCELSPTVREGVRGWNMTVQCWLANHIYRRLSYKSGPLKVAITMLVSAFWHGIYPGYYLSFLTVPLSMMAEDAMAKAFRNDCSPRQQVVYDWVCWFFKMRLFDYMCMSFLLLSLRETLRYWASIYYLGHVVAVSFILIGHFCSPAKRRQTAGEKQTAVDGPKEKSQ